MSVYITKSSLYQKVDGLRDYLKITPSNYPLNSVEIGSLYLNKIISPANFKATALRGMVSIDKENPRNDVILLNSSRSEVEQNFDCAHELIHTLAHRNLPNRTSFSCFETVKEKQDSFLEWQANEGAAELLVPYRQFIPTYLELSRKYARNFSKTPPEKELAEIYNVTETVIHNRIDSLNYEIFQYMDHGDIDKVEILSQTKQMKKGWNKRHEQLYCTKCLSPLHVDDRYCPICGTQFEKEGTAIFKYILRGAGYMKYSGIQVNEHNRPFECPNCKNEEISNDDIYCMICGKPLLNYCEGSADCPSAEVPLPSNARYCTKCGAHTTYYGLRYLSDWEEDDDENDDDHSSPTILHEFNSISDDDIPF